MSKLREKIRHYDTKMRCAAYPRITLSTERSEFNYNSGMEVRRAELHVAVDYQVPEGAPFGGCASRAAEDQLLVTLYGPLLEHIYALRSVLYSGNNEEAQHILCRIIAEVTP